MGNDQDKGTCETCGGEIRHKQNYVTTSSGFLCHEDIRYCIDIIQTAYEDHLEKFHRQEQTETKS